MTQAQQFKLLAPLSREWKSRAIDRRELRRLHNARYEVSVAVPSVDRPRVETRILRGWQLRDYMKLHGGELAEFIVAVVPIDQDYIPSIRRIGKRR